MLDASGYGNAAAYFTNSSNTTTAVLLGIQSSFMGKRPVSVYSVVRIAGTPPQGLTPNNRRSSPSSAIVGWCGPRPVAFPLYPEWNYDTPLT